MKLFLLAVLCGAVLVKGETRSACGTGADDDAAFVTGSIELGIGSGAEFLADALDIKECSAEVFLSAYKYFFGKNKECNNIITNAGCFGVKAARLIKAHGVDIEFGDLVNVVERSGDLAYLLCKSGGKCMSKLYTKYENLQTSKKKSVASIRSCYNAIRDSKSDLLERAKAKLDELAEKKEGVGTISRIVKGVLAQYDINIDNIADTVGAYDFEAIKKKAVATFSTFCKSKCYDDATTFLRDYFDIIATCKPVSFCGCAKKDDISTLDFPCCIQDIIDEYPEAIKKMKELQEVVVEVAASEVSSNEEKILAEVQRQGKCYGDTYDKRSIDHCEEA